MSGCNPIKLGMLKPATLNGQRLSADPSCYLPGATLERASLPWQASGGAWIAGQRGTRSGQRCLDLWAVQICIV